ASRRLLTLVGLLTMRTPASGRALLREVRSSFYRKLFLAFWAGAIVPVSILALFTRTYVQTQLNATAEESAARTVTTAQRLVEDYAALQQRGAAALDTIDDQIMVLVRRAIDEDANLFNRARLQATSARDLFASQLLSLRTPADVYRSILLDRLPTYVREEVVGAFHYSLAAAPVRSSGRDGIVTVPLTNRQQQIEQQIAHDIKNPLTPIQLSAEHAQRVNVDRGRPLSPVLDECVNAILGQVKLLRQISAEFSSFASSPTPRPEPTAVPALIEEVVEP